MRAGDVPALFVCGVGIGPRDGGWGGAGGVRSGKMPKARGEGGEGALVVEWNGRSRFRVGGDCANALFLVCWWPISLLFRGLWRPVSVDLVAFRVASESESP